MPENMQYPTMEVTEDGETFDYPLTFVCQINCEDIAPFDKEGKLPHEGMLYQPRILPQEFLCRRLCLLQKGHIAGEICRTHGGQTVLTLPEEIAGTAEPQILLRDAKAVCGLRHDLETFLGFGISVIGQQDAVGLVLAPAHTAAQLVKLT